MNDLEPKQPSRELETILTRLTIDESGPGTIVRDFETCLAFIAGNRLAVSKTNHLWPIPILATLNASMVHPITVNLKRPQQKSYPNLMGLYLLLRATRVVRVEMMDGTPVLRLDEPAWQSWNALNPTEKWFSLFETWYLRANPEAIGERDGPWFLPFMRCPRWYFEIPATGLVPNYKAGGMPFAAFQPYHVALLWLFGLVAIEEQSPEAGKGWQVAKVHRTPLGEAVIGYADFYCQSTLDFNAFFAWDESEDEKQLQTLSLQPAFQQFFPEWKNRLAAPNQNRFRPGSYHFKVFLEPKVWRLLAVPGEALLDDLAGGILAAFEFALDHLYKFTFRDPYGTTTQVYHPACEMPPHTDSFRVGELPLEPGMTMEFLFDFGYCWEFEVRLEAVFPPAPNLKHITFLEAKGTAPEQYPDLDDDW